MAAAAKKKRKEEAYPWKAGASSGHTTKLKQSILETFDIYDWYAVCRYAVCRGAIYIGTVTSAATFNLKAWSPANTM